MKPEYDGLLSRFAFNFNLSRCSKRVADEQEKLVTAEAAKISKVGRCRLTLSNPS